MPVVDSDKKMSLTRARQIAQRGDELLLELSKYQGEDLPEWLQAKLEQSYQLLDSAYDYLHLYSDDLEKAKGTKFAFKKRGVDKKTGKAKWIYTYNKPKTARSIKKQADEAVKGSAFVFHHNGQRGHFHVKDVNQEGTLTIVHDETNHEVQVSREALRAILLHEHKEALAAHAEKKTQRAKERGAKTKSGRHKGAEAAAERARASLKEAEAAGEKIDSSLKQKKKVPGRKPKKAKDQQSQVEQKTDSPDNFETMPEAEQKTEAPEDFVLTLPQDDVNFQVGPVDLKKLLTANKAVQYETILGWYRGSKYKLLEDMYDRLLEIGGPTIVGQLSEEERKGGKKLISTLESFLHIRHYNPIKVKHAYIKGAVFLEYSKAILNIKSSEATDRQKFRALKKIDREVGLNTADSVLKKWVSQSKDEWVKKVAQKEGALQDLIKEYNLVAGGPLPSTPEFSFSSDVQHNITGLSVLDFPLKRSEASYQGVSWDGEARAKRDASAFEAHLKQLDEKARLYIKNGADEKTVLETVTKLGRKVLNAHKSMITARTGLMSTAITGRGNFPTRQQNKKQERYDKALVKFTSDIENIFKKLSALNPEEKTLVQGEGVEQYENKLSDLAQYKELVLESRKIARSKKLSKEQKIKRMKELGFKEGDFGFNRSLEEGMPAYHLKNVNSNIARVKQQIENEKERAAILKESQGQEFYVSASGSAFEIEKDERDNRLRLNFEQKPSSEEIRMLRARGFKFSRKNQAWQRQLTTNALAAVYPTLLNQLGAKKADENFETMPEVEPEENFETMPEVDTGSFYDLSIKRLEDHIAQRKRGGASSSWDVQSDLDKIENIELGIYGDGLLEDKEAVSKLRKLSSLYRELADVQGKGEEREATKYRSLADRVEGEYLRKIAQKQKTEGFISENKEKAPLLDVEAYISVLDRTTSHLTSGLTHLVTPRKQDILKGYIDDFLTLFEYSLDHKDWRSSFNKKDLDQLEDLQESLEAFHEAVNTELSEQLLAMATSLALGTNKEEKEDKAPFDSLVQGIQKLKLRPRPHIEKSRVHAVLSSLEKGDPPHPYAVGLAIEGLTDYEEHHDLSTQEKREVQNLKSSLLKIKGYKFKKGKENLSLLLDLATRSGAVDPYLKEDIEQRLDKEDSRPSPSSYTSAINRYKGSFDDRFSSPVVAKIKKDIGEELSTLLDDEYKKVERDIKIESQVAYTQGQRVNLSSGESGVKIKAGRKDGKGFADSLDNIQSLLVELKKIHAEKSGADSKTLKWKLWKTNLGSSEWTPEPKEALLVLEDPRTDSYNVDRQTSVKLLLSTNTFQNWDVRGGKDINKMLEGLLSGLQKSFISDDLEKAKGTKFAFKKRGVDKKTGKAKWIYTYNKPKTARSIKKQADEAVKGSAFVFHHNGQRGHFHVKDVNQEGTLTIVHDETNHEVQVSREALRAILLHEHKEALAAHAEKKTQRAKERGAKTKSGRHKGAEAAAERARASLKEAEAAGEKIDSSLKRKKKVPGRKPKKAKDQQSQVEQKTDSPDNFETMPKKGKLPPATQKKFSDLMDMLRELENLEFGREPYGFGTRIKNIKEARKYREKVEAEFKELSKPPYVNSSIEAALENFKASNPISFNVGRYDEEENVINLQEERLKYFRDLKQVYEDNFETMPASPDTKVKPFKYKDALKHAFPKTYLEARIADDDFKEFRVLHDTLIDDIAQGEARENKDGTGGHYNLLREVRKKLEALPNGVKIISSGKAKIDRQKALDNLEYLEGYLKIAEDKTLKTYDKEGALAEYNNKMARKFRFNADESPRSHFVRFYSPDRDVYEQLLNKENKRFNIYNKIEDFKATAEELDPLSPDHFKNLPSIQSEKPLSKDEIRKLITETPIHLIFNTAELETRALDIFHESPFVFRLLDQRIKKMEAQRDQMDPAYYKGSTRNINKLKKLLIDMVGEAEPRGEWINKWNWGQVQKLKEEAAALKTPKTAREKLEEETQSVQAEVTPSLDHLSDTELTRELKLKEAELIDQGTLIEEAKKKKAPVRELRRQEKKVRAQKNALETEAKDRKQAEGVPDEKAVMDLVATVKAMVAANPSLAKTPEIMALLGSSDGKEESSVNTDLVITVDGQTKNVPVRYKIVEAGDAIASHDATGFFKRRDYPENVQEREYHNRKGPEQMKVINQAKNLNPQLLLNTNPDAMNGPPILTEDGIALGGNSRVMSVQRAYLAHPKKAQEYKDYLKRKARTFGFDPSTVEGFSAPLLVREYVVEDRSTQNLAKLVRAMNEGLTQAFDPLAEGKATATKLLGENRTLGALATALRTSPDGTTLRGLLRTRGARLESLKNALFADGILSSRDSNKYIDQRSGEFNDNGVSFVKKMILGYVLRDDAVLRSLTPSVEEHLETALVKLSAVGLNAQDADKLQNAIRVFNHLMAKDVSVGGISARMDPKDRHARMIELMEKDQELGLAAATKDEQTAKELDFDRYKELVKKDPLSNAFLKILTLANSSRKLNSAMDEFVKLVDVSNNLDMFAPDPIDFTEASKKIADKLSREYGVRDGLFKGRKVRRARSILFRALSPS